MWPPDTNTAATAKSVAGKLKTGPANQLALRGRSNHTWLDTLYNVVLHHPGSY
uniref:Uncharacterized protein n=1 Tax=Octopus bimaculoides TaxID=37653 RepID=A0A0L8IFC4_OCTBM